MQQTFEKSLEKKSSMETRKIILIFRLWQAL